jgi:hypothetical protein
MQISIEFKPHKSNTLQGFITVILEDYGLEIPGFTFHKKDSSKWIELPSKPPTNGSTNDKWTKVLHFYDSRKEKEFKRIVMEELMELLQKEALKTENQNLSNVEIF